MGLSNELVEDHMNALFGKERADALRLRIEKMDRYERELSIVEEISSALKEMGGRYVLPFRFKSSDGKRTSHYLIFVSKSFRGYEIMKGIMATESSFSCQGVPSLEYIAADRRYPTLFEFGRPLEDLEELLLKEFAGQSLTMQQIYEKHSEGKPYVEKNYKDVLRNMENSKRIVATPSADKRRKNTFADNVLVSFPKRG